MPTSPLPHTRRRRPDPSPARGPDRGCPPSWDCHQTSEFKEHRVALVEEKKRARGLKGRYRLRAEVRQHRSPPRTLGRRRQEPGLDARLYYRASQCVRAAMLVTSSPTWRIHDRGAMADPLRATPKEPRRRCPDHGRARTARRRACRLVRTIPTRTLMRVSASSLRSSPTRRRLSLPAKPSSSDGFGGAAIDSKAGDSRRLDTRWPDSSVFASRTSAHSPTCRWDR